jgi:hypothetical protein
MMLELNRKDHGAWQCPKCQLWNYKWREKCHVCGFDTRFKVTDVGDKWNEEREYIGVWNDTTLRRTQQYAKKRFVEGTYLIVYYIPNKRYHVYVKRAEALYWIENTDEPICGRCGLCEKREYSSKQIVWLCCRAENEHSQTVTSVGSTCMSHMETS